MKRILLLIGGVILGAAWAASARPTVATTIDFLDYVFYDTADGHDYYPPEVWEKRFAELVEAGVDKFYFRVNCCGLTLYPTGVAGRYGDDGGWHWDPAQQESAERLRKTLDAWDPLAETIRLGKKYGVEVWAWESLWDDGCNWLCYTEEQYPELVGQYGSYPLMDPFYRDRMQLFSQRDPRLSPDPAAIEALNAEARSRPIARIVVESSGKAAPVSRISRENLTLLTSEDNRIYRPYSGDFQVENDCTPDGRARVTLSGLTLKGPYVKLHHTPLPADGGFGVVVDSARDNRCRLYDADGREIPAFWGQLTAREVLPPETPPGFGRFDRFAWDHGHYQLGFLVGEPDPEDDEQRHFVGVVEFLVPEAMAHKLDRFRELADYDFDGFSFNLRSHSSVPEPSRYGFNPAVRQAFLERYGVDIRTQDFDREALNELRSEGIDEFLRRCKALTGGRPLYFGATGPEFQPEAHYNMVGWIRDFGMRWHYDRWFADGSVDGVVMIGDYYPELLEGKGVKIGVFREMAFPQKGYDFDRDMEKLFADERIDEIELYESLELTNHPRYMRKIRELEAR